jgi:hypothetical protein
MEKLLYYIVTCSYLLLPVAFFLLKNKPKDIVPTTIGIYGVFCFGFLLIFRDYIPEYLQKYFQVAYTFLEYFFFAFIFWYNIRNKSFKSFMFVASVLFLLFQVFFITTFSFKRLDSIPIGIETIFIFIYIFLFFYEFSKNTKDIFIYNHFTFWVAVGILLYLGGSFFFYMLISNLEESDVARFGNMTYIAEIIKNLLFAFSIFMYKKHPVNKTHNHSKNIPNLDMI